MKYKGKVVSSRKVADGNYKETKGKLNAGKYSKFISDSFIAACSNGYKEKKKGTTVHSTTADNPYAYFDGKKWQISKSGYSKKYYFKILGERKY